MSSLRTAALALLVSVISVAAGPALSATLDPVDLNDPMMVVQDDGVGAPEKVTLFSTEIKRDQNVQNSGRGGNDGFLRQGTSTNGGGQSINFLWGASGTSYAWSLTYDGAVAALTLGSQTIQRAITPGSTWNAVSFFLRADDTTRFSSSAATVNVDTANGAALSAPLILSAQNGQRPGSAYALAGFQALTQLSGTVRFDFTLLPRASGSPNSRLAFSVTASSVIPVEPVPLPASGLLVLGAIAMTMMARRRAA